jgi:hypothetical protein
MIIKYGFVFGEIVLVQNYIGSRLESSTVKLNRGMTRYDVEKLIGEPTSVRVFNLTGDTYSLTLYYREGKEVLRVEFDHKNKKVNGWGMRYDGLMS